MTDKHDKKFIKRRLIYLIPAGLIVIVIAAVALSQIDLDPVPDAGVQATYKVQRRDLAISVVESGEIRTLEAVNIISEADEMKTIVSIVPEGTIVTEQDVKNGKVLFELDSWEVQEQILYHQIDFVDAQASYLDAEHDYRIQLKQNASDIKAAQLAVRFAVMDMQRYFSESLADELFELEKQGTDIESYVATLVDEMTCDPNDPRWGGAALQEKRKFEAAIQLAAGELERDKNQLRGTQRLYSQGYVAFSELERDKLSFSRSQTDLQKATTAMELFLEFDFPKQSEKLVSDYVEARGTLSRVEAQARAKTSQAQSRLMSRKSIFQRETERLERHEKELAACTVKAPVPGLVIYGSSEDAWKKNTDPIEIGDGVEEGQKIITIPDTEKLGVWLGIREAWIDKIKIGQTARIVIDPFPDTVFTGRVEKVAALPDSRSRYSDSSIRLYSTQVSLGNDNGRILPGMSARVEIIIKKLQDVICVPIQAVTRNDGSKICYVITPEGVVARTVTTGEFNEAFVEITEGLQEGEKISLVPTRYSPDSQDQTR